MEAVTGRLILNEHVASVIEFMERNVPADRLEYVASRLPAMARVLWGQERCLSISRGTLSTATESVLAHTCAGDGSVVAGDADGQIPRTESILRTDKSPSMASER